MEKIKIVIVGGGTGTSVVARALKKYQKFDVTVIVTVFDSGGSAGLVLDEHGALPASDAIQAILALMPEEDSGDNRNLETLRTMLSFRFDNEPPVSGRRVGSYMMVPLERAYGSDEGISRLCDLFQTVGAVIPVATSASTLVAHYSNGSEIEGEAKIDKPDPNNEWQKTSQITGLRVEPEATINNRAATAILNADYVIFGPGDLFTSILPNVVVNGFRDAIIASRAKLVYILNLMTKPGQTGNFKASDHANTLIEYLGKRLDVVLVPQGMDVVREDIVRKYSLEGAFPVFDDLPVTHEVVRARVVSDQVFKQSHGDPVRRSLVRHDPILLGEILEGILK